MDPSPAIDDDPPIEDRGVSASFLRMFTEQIKKHLGFTNCCGWWSDRHATTTRQIVQNVIVPKTCEPQCRYVRLMRGQTDETGRPFYGRALAFVSHSWDSEWSELVDAICLHSDCWVRDQAALSLLHPTEGPSEPVTPPYYWIDIFAINQHEGTDEKNEDMPGWDSMAPHRGFQRVIRNTGGQRVIGNTGLPGLVPPGLVLALQDPWDDPRIVHRVWCLYEMTTALSVDGGRVEGLIGGKDLRNMREKFGPVRTPTSEFVKIEEAISRIDVSDAKATKQQDREEIFKLIAEKTGGVEQLNADVRKMQRRLLVKNAKRMLDQNEKKWTDEDLRAEPWLTRGLARHGKLLDSGIACAVVVLLWTAAISFEMYEIGQIFAEGRATEPIADWSAFAVKVCLLPGCAIVLFILCSVLHWRRKRLLGPLGHVRDARMTELTGLLLMGIICNFVAPIALGLAPWAVLLADRPAGEPWALFAYGLYIGLGSIGAVVLSLLVAKTLSGGAAMKDKAEFVIRVARLAQRSGMLDDAGMLDDEQSYLCYAKECLSACLKLCDPYDEVYFSLEARARLAALLADSGLKEEAEKAAELESKAHDVCAAHLTGWRRFLRRYVALGAPRSLTGLILDAPRVVTGLISESNGDGGFATHGAASTRARLHAGLKRTDEAVAELTRACELGLGVDIITDDELFQEVRRLKPEEFEKLRKHIRKNSRNYRRCKKWRRMLLCMIILGVLGSFTAGVYFLSPAARNGGREPTG
jgi:hypothetical protein